MIKIVHIISSLGRGGKERQLATIVHYSDNLRYNTKIVYFQEAKKNYISEYNLESSSLLISSRNIFNRIKELNLYLNREKPDIVYSWGNMESILAISLRTINNYKFINGSVRHGIRSNKVGHYIRTMVLHLSSIVIANSNAGLKANHLKKGYILYNGIDDKFIGKLSGLEKIEARNKLYINSNAIVLISVANLLPYKDYFTTLTALKALKDRGYLFEYIIIGDGMLKDEIIKFIDKLDLNNDVTILGQVQNVKDYLRISDIFIHSSKGEGCSNAILEAMSSGLPIIATNTGGTPEIVTKKNGILFQYKNSKELENAVIKLLDNEQIRSDFGTESLETVKSKFTTKKMMSNYYKIMDDIASN